MHSERVLYGTESETESEITDTENRELNGNKQEYWNGAHGSSPDGSARSKRAKPSLNIDPFIKMAHLVIQDEDRRSGIL